MKKILFPTDFSVTSINAFLYALNLADHLNAEIVTLHAYELPVLDSNYIDVPLYQAEVYQSLEMSTFQNYKDQIPVLRNIAETHGMGHVKISNILVQGEVAYNIRHYVKEDHIDYVVMGTRGASGMKEMFFGSVTASVMTGTNACVLAIPDGVLYEPITKIAFTTRFHDDDLTTLKRVVEVAKAFGAGIECLYVRKEGQEANEVRVANWELLFKDEDVRFHIIPGDDVEQVIIDFLEDYDISLLALLNHRHGFWESFFHRNLAKKLAYHIQIPLLALHDQ